MKDTYKNMEDIPVVFGPMDLAAILGISKNSAYNLIKSNDFPKTKIGRRIIISKKQFEIWLNKNSEFHPE